MFKVEHKLHSIRLKLHKSSPVFHKSYILPNSPRQKSEQILCRSCREKLGFGKFLRNNSSKLKLYIIRNYKFHNSFVDNNNKMVNNSEEVLIRNVNNVHIVSLKVQTENYSNKK